MTRKLLDCIELSTAESVEYSVIWLHGLGASGHDFEPIIPELQLLQRPGVRFLFPHAPVRPITVNGGAAMRAWYDISSSDFEERSQDTAGIRDSAQAVNDLVEHEIQRGVPARQIILAGFSTGRRRRSVYRSYQPSSAGRHTCIISLPAGAIGSSARHSQLAPVTAGFHGSRPA